MAESTLHPPVAAHFERFCVQLQNYFKQRQIYFLNGCYPRWPNILDKPAVTLNLNIIPQNYLIHDSATMECADLFNTKHENDIKIKNLPGTSMGE